MKYTKGGTNDKSRASVTHMDEMEAQREVQSVSLINIFIATDTHTEAAHKSHRV